MNKNEDQLLANIKIWSSDPLYKRSICGSKNFIDLATLEQRQHSRQNEYEDSKSLRNKLIVENFNLLSDLEEVEFNPTKHTIEQVSLSYNIIYVYKHLIVYIITDFT